LDEKDVGSRSTALQRLFNPASQQTARQNYDMPILLQHSQDDDVIAIDNGMRMRDMLRGLQRNVDWHEYKDGGHWINEPHGVRFPFLRVFYS
jgi:dipeptidyl aminopeptidase/acylaminoacyl peptidase